MENIKKTPLELAENILNNNIGTGFINEPINIVLARDLVKMYIINQQLMKENKQYVFSKIQKEF